MYKVLIIDDEEPVREAIRILGDFEAVGIGEILEARDGLEGIAAVREHQPELVIVDMKMPMMNGSALLKILDEEFPDIMSIVISGYDSFEFTRQAIRSKAVDYLLKPINRQELNAALGRCMEEIRSRKQQPGGMAFRKDGSEDAGLLEVSLPLLKEKLLQSLIFSADKKVRERDMTLYKATFDREGDLRHYRVAVLRIIGTVKHEGVTGISCENANDQGDSMLVEDRLRSSLIEKLEEVCTNKAVCSGIRSVESPRQLVVMVLEKAPASAMEESQSIDLFKKWHRKSKEQLGVKAVICVGKSCKGIEGLSESYEEAEKRLEELNVIGLRDGVFGQLAVNAIDKASALSETGRVQELNAASRATAAEASVTSFLNYIGILRSTFEKGGTSYLMSLMEEYLSKLGESGSVRIRDAEKVMEEFGIVMRDLCAAYGAVPPSGLERLKEYGFCSFEEFGDILKEIASKCLCQVRQSMKAGESFSASEIREYIDRNYAQDIKISMFTERYYLSREYIMKLFKKEYGVGIHEYIQNVRMEKAKLLLGDEQIKIQSISQLLGYSDTNYFSKAFKTYYGITPSDYRCQRHHA